MQEVARLYAEMETGGRLDESALNAAREVIVDDWAKRNARLLERRAENRDKLIAVQKNRLEDWRIEKFIRNAEAYIEQNGTSGDEVDKEATSAKMYSMIAAGGSWGDAEKTVQQWVRPRLTGCSGSRVSTTEKTRTRKTAESRSRRRTGTIRRKILCAR